MSIVIIENDHYRKAREQTKAEEKKINAASDVKKSWKKRGLLPGPIVAVIVAAIIFPLGLLWLGVIGGIIFSFVVSLAVLKIVGSMIGRWR